MVSSLEFARRRTAPSDPVRVAAISTVTPTFPNTAIEMPNFATDSAAGARPRPSAPFNDSIAARRVRGGGHRPRRPVDVAEVYDLSTALELDWYENIGLCAGRGREAAARRRHRRSAAGSR